MRVVIFDGPDWAPTSISTPAVIAILGLSAMGGLCLGKKSRKWFDWNPRKDHGKGEGK